MTDAALILALVTVVVLVPVTLHLLLPRSGELGTRHAHERAPEQR